MCGTREVTVVESLVNRYLLWYLGYFGHLSIWFAVHFEQQEELFIASTTQRVTRAKVPSLRTHYYSFQNES